MKLQIKMKVLIATAIAILLVATACSGGDDLSVTTNQVGFSAGPTTTTESDGSSNLVEVFSEPAPVTTEPTTTTAAPIAAEPSETVSASAADGSVTYKTTPQGKEVTYGRFSRKNDFSSFYFDIATLPPYIAGKTTPDGEKLFYIKELDEYQPCWKALNEGSQVTENGYCGSMTLFLNNEGNYVASGVIKYNFLEERKETDRIIESHLDREQGDFIINSPFYDIPDPLPPSASKLVILRLLTGELITVPCKDVGNIHGNYEWDPVYRATFWIHEDGLCKSAVGEYLRPGDSGRMENETYCKGVIIRPARACNYNED